jgi:hypothetical protein
MDLFIYTPVSHHNNRLAIALPDCSVIASEFASMASSTMDATWGALQRHFPALQIRRFIVNNVVRAIPGSRFEIAEWISLTRQMR